MSFPSKYLIKLLKLCDKLLKLPENLIGELRYKIVCKINELTYREDE